MRRTERTRYWSRQRERGGWMRIGWGRHVLLALCLIVSPRIARAAADGASAVAPAAETTERDLAGELFSPAVALPEYSAEEAAAVPRAQAVRVAWNDVFNNNALIEKVENADSDGQDSRLLSEGELRQLLKPKVKPAPAEMAEVGEEGFYNLWTVDQQNWDDRRTVVALAFKVGSREAKTVTLGIGCDFGMAVIVNGRPIYARVGYQAFGEGSDLVPLPLAKGVNQVVVAFQQRQKKKIRSLFATQWIAGMKLFPEAAEARENTLLWNRHPVVTPILRRLEGMVLRGGPPYWSSVEIVDLDGAPRAGGTIERDGRVDWETKGTTGPFCGIVVVDGRVAEPIVIEGPAMSLEATVKALAGPHAGDEVSKAWAYRAQHLLEPQFADQRVTLEWKQKLVAAVAGARRPEALAGLAAGGRGGLQLGSYHSKLDGSVQYFLYYLPESRPAEASGRPRVPPPLVVMVPTVSDPVRPFLDSGTLAGQQEHEMWCSVADRYGCMLLWPGYNDVDYGGELSQFALAENIAAFQRRVKSPGDEGGTFLFAPCSAGVLATRFAARHRDEVAGLALYSPELHRRNSRYTPGLPTHVDSTIPLVVQEADTPADVARRLQRMRCAVLYDSSMPGHGDEAALRDFARAGRETGLEVTELHAAETHEYIWGERMKYRLGLFLEWIARANRTMSKERQTTVAEAPGLTASKPTIASALRQGFYLAECDTEMRPWLETWKATYATWRGAPLPTEQPDANAVPVSLVRWDAPTLLRQSPEMRGSSEGDPAGAYFGAVLIEEGGTRRVAVFATPNAHPPYPEFDLVLDGHFRCAVFESVGPEWRRIEGDRERGAQTEAGRISVVTAGEGR